MADVSKILDKLSPWADYKGEYVRVTPAELRALVEEVRRLDELLNGWQMIATNAEAELARLRAPAGEMGEVVKRLKEYAYPPKVEMEVGKTYTIRAPLADEFKDTLMTAADLLTRQAAEIESLKGWKDSWRSQLQKTVDTENTLLTALKVMHSARDSGDLSEMDIFLNDLETKTND